MSATRPASPTATKYTGPHLEPHTTFDLTLGKDFGERFSLSVTGLNVANRRVLLDNSFTLGGTHYNNPREIFAQLRYRFQYSGRNEKAIRVDINRRLQPNGCAPICSRKASSHSGERHFRGHIEETDYREAGDIPGMLPAMTMTFIVGGTSANRKTAAGGQNLRRPVASVCTVRLERIELVVKGDGKTAPGAAQRIPAKGESVPGFALTNQDSRKIHLSDYRSRALLISFIYTRCSLLDFCPRMSENFCGVRNLLAQTLGVTQHAAILGISDPRFDTPIDCKFATPSEKDLPELAQFFGRFYQPQERQIVHSVSNTLIDLDDGVEQWYSGNSWTRSEVTTALSAPVQKAS